MYLFLLTDPSLCPLQLLALDAIHRLKGSGQLSAIQIIKFLEPGFLLGKKSAVHQPKGMKDAKILIANTPIDTDKIKVFGSSIKVDAVSKFAEDILTASIASP